MKNTLLTLLVLCLCCLYPVSTLKAQLFVTRIEKFRDQNLWLQTCNPTGLKFNPASLFSIVTADYSFTNGKRKMATEATSSHHFSIHTETYRHFRQIKIHGRFRYENNMENGRQWQMSLQPGAHLTDFGDTVPARQYLEFYNIYGAIALPLGKGWNIGTGMDYHAGTGRKHSDPRNQNEQINISLTPGVLYCRKTFSIGIHFKYQRIVEKIDYSIFDGGSYDVLTSYPLWFYIRENLLKGDNSSRSYTEKRFSGGIQLGEKNNKFEWLSEWCYTEGTEICDIIPSEKSRMGETRRQEFTWNGQLRLHKSLRHTFRPYYYRLVRTGYDNLQSKSENSTSPGYLHFGKVKRSAIVNDLLSLDYSLLSAYDSLSDYREIKIRGEWQREQALFFIYPATFKQTIRSFALSADYTRQFQIRQHTMELTAGVTYKNGNGALPQLRSEKEYPLPEIKIPMQKNLQLHDFHIRTAETIHYSAATQYTCNFKSAKALFIRTTAGYLHGLSGYQQAAGRFHCSLSTGLLF